MQKVYVLKIYVFFPSPSEFGVFHVLSTSDSELVAQGVLEMNESVRRSLLP